MLSIIFPEHNWNSLKEQRQQQQQQQYSTLSFLTWLQQQIQQQHDDYAYIAWSFTNAPHSFWRSHKCRRLFVDWCGHSLFNISNVNDWQHVTAKQLINFGMPRAILYEYNDSVTEMLRKLYPELKFRDTVYGISVLLPAMHV